MEKSLIHFVVMLPTGNQPAIISEPGNSPFDFPTAPVTSESSAILKFFSFVSSWRSHKLNASAFEVLTQLIRVIGFVSHQVLWFSAQLVNRLINERYLMWTGRGKGHSQRNTPAIRHHHELGALAPLGFPDFWAPFFADTKLPSIKHSAQSIWPFLSSSLMKVRQSFSQTPSSSHLFKRLQQVLGLGYFSGKSFHLAPVRRIQRMPSTVKRLFFQGRPLLFNFGSNGSIFFHCFSVKYIARLIGFPPMNLFIGNHL
jgi:hypothetical protein